MGDTATNKGAHTMANAIDLHVGKRLRRRRRLLGLTQQQLAESIGIRFQQIQKYECGANRVTASRLYELAVALNVPVNYFFEGLQQVANPATPGAPANDRDLIDLLAAERGGRLAVLELKASEDIHLPLQALDYWMRVDWHVRRDEFTARGYFPGRALTKMETLSSLSWSWPTRLISLLKSTLARLSIRHR